MDFFKHNTDNMIISIENKNKQLEQAIDKCDMLNSLMIVDINSTAINNLEKIGRKDNNTVIIDKTMELWKKQQDIIFSTEQKCSCAQRKLTK